jgi:tetratricopeptide (TPR) repeat protein
LYAETEGNACGAANQIEGVMKNSEKLSQADFERIEFYLLDRMTESEKQDFLEEVETDEELKEELEVQRELIRAVEAGAFKERLERLHKHLVRRRHLMRWLAIAASVAVFLSVGVWLLNKPNQTERLFAENLTVEPGLPLPMTAVDDYDFYDAMVDYKSGEYKLAGKKWMQLLKKDPENDTLNYFIGIALFNDEEYQKAEPYFKKVIELNSASYNGKSEWYLALSYLKTNDIEKLRSLAGESHSDYTPRINRLIQKLE